MAAQTQALEAVDAYTGAARVAVCTVIHGRGKTPRAMALLDLPSGQRALTITEHEGWVARLRQEEGVGRPVKVADQQLLP